MTQRLTTLSVAAVLALLAGCTVGARSGRRMAPSYETTGEAPCSAGPLPAAPAEPPAARPNPDKIPGTPSIRVVWEALSVEKARSDASPYRRPDGSSDPALSRIVGTTEFQIILLNTSFVATSEQEKDNKSLPPSGRIARVKDQDMLDLVSALERLGFYKYAQPTGSLQPLFASDRARGRITVERDGQSMTLLSQRWLGLRDETKAIPAIYSDGKQAIVMLKNRSPTLRVRGTTVEAADPRRVRPNLPGTPPPADTPPAGSPAGPAPGGSGK